MLLPALHQRNELSADVGDGRVVLDGLTGVVLEVRGALAEAVESVLEPIGIHVAEAEDLGERHHADRLEVLPHQLGSTLRAAQQSTQIPLDDRLDEVVDVLGHTARSEARVERSPELLVLGTVHRHQRATTEIAIDRRLGSLRGEDLRPLGHELHVGIPGDEPALHSGHP